ncbi:MAG: glutamate racemase [Sulfurovum sp.]|nr:glutamate racemase [Sulfurovum sp.]MCB4746222.1 glutamate racemase [Sulfurovum sp.]MCB4747822.1 glutamate racemase [Sulfurovum sp.]MCB4749222.1 glutamate racemase [Sulfurovum sp.]MCB4757999.1 glutamate racemase [Sulfurovum sp.]
MRSEELRVGVFDSGLGGLTVVKAIQELIKGAKLFYIADTIHAPYGEKTEEEIRQYTIDITDFLIEHHQIDVLVVACNTATSAAIEVLRKCYTDFIIIGTEPAVKPAIEQTKTGKIGILATPATLKGDKYRKLVDNLFLQRDITLFEQACPGLVKQIEAGKIDHPKTQKMLESWLRPMRDEDVDTIVLGCTHYPLVGDMIVKIMGNQPNLIHTGEPIARRLLSLLVQQGYKNKGDFDVKLYTTGKIDRSVVSTLLGFSSHITSICI